MYTRRQVSFSKVFDEVRVRNTDGKHIFCCGFMHSNVIILPMVLYGHDTWSLTLREEQRLRVFENRVLRRIFGPERDEVTGE
jgi:hypothetical protein